MRAPRSLNPLIESLDADQNMRLSLMIDAAKHPADVMPGLLRWLFQGDLDLPLLEDLVCMSLGARVSVDFKWSWNRIKDEHDRVARLITLAELRKDPVVFDIPPEMDNLIPGFKPIRSNIRLGIEGLRQRHCVVDRLDRIVAGEIVIFSGVVQGERWTMTYERGSKTLTEIKGRFNVNPSQGIKEQITDSSQIFFGSAFQFNGIEGAIQEGMLRYMREYMRLEAAEALGIGSAPTAPQNTSSLAEMHQMFGHPVFVERDNSTNVTTWSCPALGLSRAFNSYIPHQRASFERDVHQAIRHLTARGGITRSGGRGVERPARISDMIRFMPTPVSSTWTRPDGPDGAHISDDPSPADSPPGEDG